MAKKKTKSGFGWLWDAVCGITGDDPHTAKPEDVIKKGKSFWGSGSSSGDSSSGDSSSGDSGDYGSKSGGGYGGGDYGSGGGY